MRRKTVLKAILAALLIGASFTCYAWAGSGFVIHKTDDNGDPVKGAVFSVYGKPEVSYTTKPAADPAPCEDDPPVEKMLSGDEPTGDYEFSFTMKAEDPSYPMVPGSADGIKTVTLTAPGPVAFGTITFTEEGTYEYMITEDDLGEEGFDYDENSYRIRYVVENKDGRLEAARTFFKNNEIAEGLEMIPFENRYTTPAQETIEISGAKIWPDGERPKLGWTIPGSITVILQKNAGNGWTDVESRMVSKDADTGEWSYDFGEQPRFDGSTEIEYRVIEEPVAGYIASGGTAADNYNLTNEYDTRTITLTKTWAGDSGAGARPDAMRYAQYLDLYRDDEKLGIDDAPMPDVTDNGDNTYTVTYIVPRINVEGNEAEYKIEETDVPDYAEGAVTGSMEEGFAITNTYSADSFNITVSMKYENGYPKEWGTDLGWGGIVRGNQTVTITNTATGVVKTLSFAPVKGGGGSAAQTVQLAEGTYTISQAAYALTDLDASADKEGYIADLYLMRTIDQTVTIDASGNCTLSTPGNQPGNSFHAQCLVRSNGFNPETGDYDLPVYEPDSTGDETGAGSYVDSCTASGSSITLKSIISNGDPELQDI